jgi:outer membrane protein
MQEFISKRAAKPSLVAGDLTFFGLIRTGLALFALTLNGTSTGFSAEVPSRLNSPAPPPSWLTQPLSLPDALTVALQRNSAILKGQSDLKAAHGIAIQNRAIALPKVRALAGYDHNEAVEISPFSIINPPRDEWSGNVRIEQSIYEGGRIVSGIRTARLVRDQALLRYQVTLADTLYEVRTAYYNVLQAEQEIAVRAASVNLLNRELTNTIQRFDAGAVPRFDVLRGEVEVANARPRLIRAQNAYRVAKTSFATLLGYNVPPGVGEDLPLTLTDKLQSIPYDVNLTAAIAQAMQRRPELGVLKLEESLRRESVTVAKAGYKPSFLVFAGYGGRNTAFQDEFFRDVSGAMAGVEMRWNIFDGFATRGRVIEAEANREKAHYDLEDIGRRIEQQVRVSYSAFVEAREVLESQKKVQEQAEEALRLAVARYEAGTGTQLDVLNAQTALTEARTTQIEALRNYQVSLAELGRAIGSDAPQNTSPPAGK